MPETKEITIQLGEGWVELPGDRPKEGQFVVALIDGVVLPFLCVLMDGEFYQVSHHRQRGKWMTHYNLLSNVAAWAPIARYRIKPDEVQP